MCVCVYTLTHMGPVLLVSLDPSQRIQCWRLLEGLVWFEDGVNEKLQEACIPAKKDAHSTWSPGTT